MKKALILLPLGILLSGSNCDSGGSSSRTGEAFYRSDSGPVAPIPEPSAGILFVAGLLILGISLRLRRTP